MALKLIGDIAHGEKYTNAQGEEKWKNTYLGTLWKDEEKGEYVINIWASGARYGHQR